jgi:sugar/nucleoside kinase (ribokinase family)
MSLLTLGTVAFDTILTPFGKAERVVGGAALYAAWSASYFTNDIKLLSIVGDDFPQEEIKALQNRGVDTDGLEIVKGGKTFFWKGTYHNDFNTRDTLVTELNVLEDFEPTLPKSYMNSDYVLLGNLAPDTQSMVLDQFRKRPKFVAMDTMNYWLDVALLGLKDIISKVDALIINDEEARLLAGEYSLHRASKIILAMGPKYLVIKKGEHGALLFHENNIFYAPALPLPEVYDPTGAGDSFAGGLMGYLAMTDEVDFDNLKRAVIYGSVVASYCVEDFSIDKLRNLTHHDLRTRLEEFVDIVHFNVY